MLPNPAIFTRILGTILSVDTTWCDDGTSDQLIESVATFFKNSKSENIGTLEELIQSEKVQVTRKELQETRANERQKKGPKEKSAAAATANVDVVEVPQNKSKQDASNIHLGKTTASSDTRTKYNRTGKNQKSTGVFGDADALKGKGGRRKGKERSTTKANQSKAVEKDINHSEDDANVVNIDSTSKRKRKPREKKISNVTGLSSSNRAAPNASVINVSDVTVPKAIAALPAAVTISLPSPPTNSDIIFDSDPIYDFVSRQMKSLHKLGIQKKRQKMQMQRENIVLDSRFQNHEQGKEAKSKQHHRNQTFLDSQAAIINQQQALYSLGMMQQQQHLMGMGMNMNMGMMQQQPMAMMQQQQMAMGMGNGFNPNQMFMMQQQQMAMMGGTSSNKMDGMATGFAGRSPQQLGGMSMNNGMGMSMGNEMAQSRMATPTIASTTNSKKVKQGNTNEDVIQNMSIFQQTPLYNPALFMGMTPQQAGEDMTNVSDASDNESQDDVDWSDSDGEELSSNNEDDETPAEDGNK
jgi:hypothetical protein